MINKEGKDIIDKALCPMKCAMGLEEFSICTYYESLGPSVMGCITPDPGRRAAEMSIDLQKHDNKKELLKTLRHELLHLISFQMEIFRKTCHCYIPVGDSKDAVDEIWDDASESLVFNMETMLDACGMTPEHILKRGLKTLSKGSKI